MLRWLQPRAAHRVWGGLAEIPWVQFTGVVSIEGFRILTESVEPGQGDPLHGAVCLQRIPSLNTEGE